MKSKPAILLTTALCLVGCETDAERAAAKPRPQELYYTEFGFVRSPDGRQLECVYYNGSSRSMSCNWEKYNAEGKVQP